MDLLSITSLRHLRVQVRAFFGVLIPGFDKFQTKAQIGKSLGIGQALNSLFKCKMARLKIRFQGGNSKQNP